METTFKIIGNDISDGYHTFGDLYKHRVALFITLCKNLDGYKYANTWRSKLHSDETSFEGWFVLGINKEKGKQITYHLPMSEWEKTNFAETLDKAPEYDGHTSNDVLERLSNF